MILIGLQICNVMDYRHIIKKNILFKYLFLFLRYLFIVFFIFLLYLFFKTIFIVKINKLYMDNIKINTELIINPEIQLNDEDNNLTFIVSTDGLINEDFNKITLHNVNIKNDFFEAFSKKVIYENDEIIFKERPSILFYNNNR